MIMRIEVTGTNRRSAAIGKIAVRAMRELPSVSVKVNGEVLTVNTMKGAQAWENGGTNVALDPTMHFIGAARCRTATTTGDMWWKTGADIT
jgi:hypothetical protein